MIGGDHPVWDVLPGLPPAERLVLAYYAAAAGAGGYAWPSLDHIAGKTGYSRDQLWRARKSLVARGELILSGKGPGQRADRLPNRYRVRVCADPSDPRGRGPVRSTGPRGRGERVRVGAANGSAPTRTKEPGKNHLKGEEGDGHVDGPGTPPATSGPAPLEEDDSTTIARRLVDRKPDEAGPAIRRLIADYDAELVRLVLRMLEAEGAAYGFARQLEADARHRIDELDDSQAEDGQADEATPRTRIPAPGDCPARGVEDWHTLSPSAFVERNPDDPTDRSAWPCPICNPHGPDADSPDYPPTLAAIRRDHYPELYQENTDP